MEALRPLILQVKSIGIVEIFGSLLVKALILLAFLLSFALLSHRFFNFGHSVLSHPPKYEGHQVKNLLAPLVDAPIEKVEPAFKINSYDFSKVSPSFKDNDLSFASSLNKADFEQLFIKSFPQNLQDKVKVYAKAIIKISELYQVDPFWVSSIMWTESHFEWNARSKVGASGLMQIMPKTKEWLYWKLRAKNNFLLVEKDNFNINDYFNFKVKANEYRFLKYRLVNIELGVYYLKRLLNRFDQNHTLATIAYNMGPNWTSRKLKQNYPLGQNNLYLNKVKLSYTKLSKSLWTLTL